MESIAREQERSRRRFPNRVSCSIDYSESIRFQSFSACHRSTINNFNRSEHDQNIDTASRQSLQRQALKTRLAVLNEKGQPSVAMVIHTCHESDAIVDEDLSNGAANKELDPHRSSPRKVTRVERTLHRKRMLAARRTDVLPEVFFPWPRLRPMLKDYTPMLRLSS